jgi:hypothetical protein
LFSFHDPKTVPIFQLEKAPTLGDKLSIAIGGRPAEISGPTPLEFGRERQKSLGWLPSAEQEQARKYPENG